MNSNKFVSLSTIFSVLLLVACGGNDESASPGNSSESENAVASQSARTFAAVDEIRLLAAATEPGQWMSHGGDYKEQRFSQLEQINTENIDALSLSWFADLETNRGQESTPLMVDGVLYVTEAWSKVSAFNARTGERLWFYDPEVPGEKGSYGCCDVVNRGVAVWEGKVYVGAYDGRLIALDAETGTEVWSEVTVDQSKFYTITGAPRVANGKVFIGNAGAEYITRGYMSAYDAETGELVWRFYTVPGNPELGFESDAMRMAAETWNGEWWELGGGGSTWDAITYDPDTNLLYFGVGNGSPWNAAMRSPEGGDNLFTVSIVAVDADTGEYVWHYQEIPAEEWDFDSVQQITVADLEVDGAMRHVLMQATKSGYYYMLDAYTGELLVAENFVPVNWTFGYDMETGRPNINEAAQYTKNEGPRISQPGPIGAHSWHPMSFSPETGLLYIPARESSIAYTNAPDLEFGNFSIGVSFFGGDEAYEDPDNTIERGGPTRLIAWDPIQGEEVWSVDREQGAPAGILSTAGGLVFQGNGDGQEFVAYNAESGEQLWSADIQTGVSAGPISYELDGVQYIAQVVGGSNPGGYYAPSYARLLVFSLGGTAQLPEKIEFTQRPFDPPELTASPEVVAAGEEIYSGACSLCHGNGGVGRGMFPDLRRSPLLHSDVGFDAVVLQGILSERGMVSFADELNAEDTAAVRAYLATLAEAALNAPAFGPPGAP
ncbi:PQQ-dependent dehydrogenase, methanol/ethanol family [Gammaproteobacteria bacterium]|nr:PQQ-dependent dehydrogenase, methanol/ethanol family [Gammaproteobacteria bacterium]